MPNTKRKEYPECAIENRLQITSVFTLFKRRFANDYTFQGEAHDFTEVVCVVDGKVGVTADKNVYVLSAGQMILHPPSEFHAIWSDCGSEPEVIIFSFRAAAFPDLPKFLFSVPSEQIRELKQIAEDAKEIFDSDGESILGVRPKAEARAAVLLKRLEIFLLSVFDGPDRTHAKINGAKQQGRSVENYRAILSYMEKHIGEPLSIDEIAGHCNMSVPAVEKTVKRYLGCGAMSYFNTMKMLRAAEMLSGGASVKETALSVGFSNQNYFSARFKKWSGVAPSEWKSVR